MVIRSKDNGAQHGYVTTVQDSSTEMKDGDSASLVIDPEELKELLADAAERRAASERWLERLRIVWSQRRVLSRVAVAGFLVATLIAFLIPKRYQSWTQLMPPDSQSVNGLAMMAAASGQGGLGSLASDLLGMKSSGALFVGVMQGHAVQYRIIDRFNLEKVYRTRLRKDARERLSEMTSISEDRKTGIITLTVTDRDPNRAAAIAGAYIEDLNTMMVQLTTSSAHRERVFLEQRLATVKQDLENSEKDLSEFSSKNSTVDITAQAKAMVESAATVEGEMIAAQAELDGLKQIYTEKFPRVRALQARIDELHHELAKQTAGARPEALGGQVATRNGENGTIDDISYPKLRQLPILGVPYADKLRRTRVEEAVFEALTKEYELAKVQEAKEIPTVKVLDPPEVPEEKSYPQRLIIMFEGTMCSLIAGLVWVFGTTCWRGMSSKHQWKLFAQEVLGALMQLIQRSAPSVKRSGTPARECLGPSSNGDVAPDH